MMPAGFWRRYAAWSLDMTIIGLPILLVLWPWMRRTGAALVQSSVAWQQQAMGTMLQGVDNDVPTHTVASQVLSNPQLHAGLAALQSQVFALIGWPTLLFAVVGAVYHVAFETSSAGATPGQRALGLRVVDMQGHSIGALRALTRHLAGALSWITLNLGHAMALVPPKRQALHDLVSGTRVVQDASDTRALPPLARAWIALQLLALFGACVAFTLAASHAMQASIDALN